MTQHKNISLDLLCGVVYTSRLVNSGISLVPAWQCVGSTLVNHEAQNFFKRLEENWFQLPPSETLRIRPTFAESGDSIDWQILTLYSGLGEMMGMLDDCWLLGSCLVLLKHKVQSGSMTDTDIAFFKSAVSLLPTKDIEEKIKWKEWSQETNWLNIQIQDDPSNTLKSAERWLMKIQNLNLTETTIPAAIEEKLKETAFNTGMEVDPKSDQLMRHFQALCKAYF